MEKKEIALTRTQQKLTSQLESARSLINRKILFDDTRDEHLNAYNLPTYDSERERKKGDVLHRLCKTLKEFVDAKIEAEEVEKEQLTLENRSSSATDKLRNMNVKMREAMNGQQSLLALSETMWKLAKKEGAKDMETTKASLFNYLEKWVAMEGKLLSYRELKIQECVVMMAKDMEGKKKFEVLGEMYRRRFAEIEKLKSYASLLLTSNGAASKNSLSVFQKILEIFKSIHQMTLGYFCLFSFFSLL